MCWYAAPHVEHESIDVCFAYAAIHHFLSVTHDTNRVVLFPSELVAPSQYFSEELISPRQSDDVACVGVYTSREVRQVLLLKQIFKFVDLQPHLSKDVLPSLLQGQQAKVADLEHDPWFVVSVPFFAFL